MGFATHGLGRRSESWLDHKTTLVWMGRRTFGRRTHRLFLLAGAALLLFAAALFSAYAYVAVTVRDRAVAALSTKLGRDVRIAEVDIGFSAIALEGVEIDGLGSIDRVVAGYEFSSLFGADIEVDRVDAYGLEFEISRDANGVTSIDDITEKLRAKGEAKEDGKRGMLTGVPIALHDVTLRARDDRSGTSVEFHAAHATPNRKDSSVEINGGELRGRSNHPRLGHLLASSIAEADGSVMVRDGGLALNLAGSFAGAAGERWKVVGAVDLGDRSASLHLETEAVSVGRLGTTVRGLLTNPKSARASVAVDIDATLDRATLSGEATISGLDIAHPRVARAPVEDISFTASGEMTIDRAAKSVAIRDGKIRSGDAQYDLQFDTELDGDATLSATLSIGKTPCQAVLDSIPSGLVPDLQGFKLSGEMAASVVLAIDWADLDKTVFSTDVLGQAGIDNCQVLEAPERFSADRLRGSFEHRVPVGNDWMTFTVGPENENYVPLSKVSRNLTRSLMTTEDSRFYRHRGFITKEFRMALIKNLERGRFAYGASSISMQVVKNVMLERAKTVSRKFEELFLTWYIERELSKDRILEIYVNAIEFGPGIYGIKPAAKRYFNKHPRRLNPVESAFFSSILPAPVRRFKQYCRGWAGRWTQGKIDRILDLMLERNRLDEEQYWNAIGTPLVFRGSRRDICSRYYEDAKKGNN